MRILHIITSLRIGGAEQALYNYLSAAQKSDMVHHVAFFHDGPLNKKIQSLGIQTTHIRGVLHRYDPFLLIRLIRLIKIFQPNVIHSSLWSANIISRIAAKILAIPLICDLHGKCTHEGRMRNILDRATCSFACSHVAVSQEIKKLYQRHIIPAQYASSHTADTVIVIRNSINVDQIRQQAHNKALKRSDIGLDEHDYVIGSIGRLESIKSYDVLLKAFAAIKQIATKPLKLCLVGDGSERNNLETLAQNLNLKHRVLFVGMRNDAYRFYPLFDCFALSSQSEGISIALLEALAFGLPIVTTHAYKTHEIITHGINGMLCPINNLRLITKHLSTLYTNDDIRKTMSKRNYRYAQKTFNIENIVKQYHKAFEKVREL
ncbi:MAG: glycosyltransferase [Epsilonproteobacteria bacterium]|nr:glycosyltransferase [Campylobacterota bacterium]